MISEADAIVLAQEFAQRKLGVPGYSLEVSPARQASETDWAFAIVLTGPDGVGGTPQIVLVTKSGGLVRTLREAIREGWGRP
jgi:hypothetical protein